MEIIEIVEIPNIDLTEEDDDQVIDAVQELVEVIDSTLEDETSMVVDPPTLPASVVSS